MPKKKGHPSKSVSKSRRDRSVTHYSSVHGRIGGQTENLRLGSAARESAASIERKLKQAESPSGWTSRILSAAQGVLSRQRGVTSAVLDRASDLKASVVRRVRGRDYYQDDPKRCITYFGILQDISSLQQTLGEMKAFFQPFRKNASMDAYYQTADTLLAQIQDLNIRVLEDQLRWANDASEVNRQCTDRRLIRNLSALQSLSDQLEKDYRRIKPIFGATGTSAPVLTAVPAVRFSPSAPGIVTPILGLPPSSQDSQATILTPEMRTIMAIPIADPMARPPAQSPSAPPLLASVSQSSIYLSPDDQYRELVRTLPGTLQTIIQGQGWFRTAQEQSDILPILRDPSNITGDEAIELKCRMDLWSRSGAVDQKQISYFQNQPDLKARPRLKLVFLRNLTRHSPFCQAPIAAPIQQLSSVPLFGEVGQSTLAQPTPPQGGPTTAKDILRVLQLAREREQNLV